MSVSTFLSRAANGAIKMYQSISSSSGASDADKIISTNAAGVIDPSLLPPGTGPQIQSAEADVALNAGDFVYIFDDTGTIKAGPADASDVTKYAMGFVLMSAAMGATVDVYLRGVNTAITVPGADVGKKYFLDVATAGTATTTAPTVIANNYQQVVGYGVETGVYYEFEDYLCFNYTA